MLKTVALPMALLASVGIADTAGKTYPVAKKVHTIIDKHGIRVADPYAWMENDHDPDLQEWIRNQNNHTDMALRGTLRAQLEEEFTGIVTKERAKEKARRKSRIHLQNQQQRWQRQIAPTNLKEDILDSFEGRYSITQESESGSDLRIVRVRDNATGAYLNDLLKVKFASFFWEEGDRSFIYKSDRDSRLGDSRPIIRRHVLGTKQNMDEVIFESPQSDTWLGLQLIDGRWLLTLDDRFYVKRGYLDMESGEFTPVWEQSPTVVYDFAAIDGLLYQISFETSDRGEIVTRDLASGERTVVIEEGTHAIDSATLVGSKVFVTVIDHAANRLYSYDLSDEEVAAEEIDLPGIGSASLFANEAQLYISYQSYTEPSSLWILDSETNTLKPLEEAGGAELDLTAKRISYRAHDGRRATIWLVHKTGLTLDRRTPVYLYGYGGFSVNIMPRFRTTYNPWYERGGVLAVVTLPGGLEYGKGWMEAGQLFNKKNVFDDFAAAARALIRRGYTQPAKLAIGGGSNGGLLVGATANLYPELFAAAVPEVGVMDLANFKKFTGGKWWQTDYGNSAVRSEYRLQLSLSPYHQIRAIRNPATLVIPADHDDRVVPSHAYRFAARLQEMQRGSRPILLHTRLGASHGATGTVAEEVRYRANMWTFILQQLGVE